MNEWPKDTEANTPATFSIVKHTPVTTLRGEAAAHHTKAEQLRRSAEQFEQQAQGLRRKADEHDADALEFEAAAVALANALDAKKFDHPVGEGKST
jgi:hypothetical protein